MVSSASIATTSSNEEAELVAELLDLFKEKLAETYEKGGTKRIAHPKCLGFVKGTFQVLEDIPKHLQVGVFAKPGATYKSWIRVSSSTAQSIPTDKVPDARGIAIKLLGVSSEEGGRLEQGTDRHTQDFLLMSNPTMPLGTLKLFRDFVYFSNKWHALVFALKALLTGRKDILVDLKKIGKNHTSPLDISYWSATPYRCGTLTQVKYKLVPTSTKCSVLPDELYDDYLTANMQSHLQNDPATFDFFMQEFVDEEQTPIEDAGIEWKESISPFIRVATLTIPPQTFRTPERFEMAEQCSYCPANSLQVHEPLGNLNRGRMLIYGAMSKFRHARNNNEQMIEPLLEDYDSTA